MKYFIIILGMLSTISLASGDSEIESMKKIIAIQQAQIEKLTHKSTFEAGAIQHSVLTESQFQKLNGSSWVLMDGRSIGGSELSKITGWTSLPDARGRFLRVLGGSSAALGQIQSDATATNGLKNKSSRVTGGVSINHDHGSIKTSSEGQHSHNTVNSRAAIFQNGGGTRYEVLLSRDSYPDESTRTTYSRDAGSHNHSARIPELKIAQRPLLSGAAAAQVIEGDLETRPENLTVNVFIKIN